MSQGVTIPKDAVQPLMAFLSLYSLKEMHTLQFGTLEPLERQSIESGLHGLHDLMDKLKAAIKGQPVPLLDFRARVIHDDDMREWELRPEPGEGDTLNLSVDYEINIARMLGIDRDPPEGMPVRVTVTIRPEDPVTPAAT